MNSVKQINIFILDDKIYYEPGEDESNITDEMHQKWDEVFTKFVAAIKNVGLLTDLSIFERNDATFTFTSKDDISFDKSVELMHTLENSFKVSSFSFNTEYDDWYDEDPSVDIGIYSTI